MPSIVEWFAGSFQHRISESRARLRIRADYPINMMQNALHLLFFSVTMKRMAKTKVSTLNLRINPAIKLAVREAAAREHRSVANMVEVLIRRHCDQAGITILEQADFFPRKENG